MFVYSLKAKRLKLAGIAVLALATVVTVLLFAGREKDTRLCDVAATGKEVRFDGIKTDEDVVKFINSVGISVKTPAVKVAEVELPRVFDAVYSRYNDIQKQQGFDLSKYCGKTLKRYTFEVTDYVGAGENSKVYLTLFLHKDKVVGGDISSRDNGGFVKTFVDYGI